MHNEEAAMLIHPQMEFPPPWRNGEEVNVNMLPFKFGEKATLPENVQRYFAMTHLLGIPDSEKGKVMYLSVHECWVEPGKMQRRGGLHVESPGQVLDANMDFYSGIWGEKKTKRGKKI